MLHEEHVRDLDSDSIPPSIKFSSFSHKPHVWILSLVLWQIGRSSSEQEEIVKRMRI